MTIVKVLATTFAREARVAAVARPGEWVRSVRVYTEPDEVEAIMADADGFVSEVLGALPSSPCRGPLKP